MLNNIGINLTLQSFTKTLFTNKWAQMVCLLYCFIGFSVSATSLKVGDKAPNFNLQATTGDFYNLKDFIGKTNVVLAWYPRANTRGCTIECKSLVEKGHLIRAFNAKYFMASVDELDANRDFAKKTKADFPC